MDLSFAPMTCMKLINNIVLGILGQNIFAYLVDILVVIKDLPSHFTQLQSLLDKFLHARLKVNISDASFLKHKLDF